MAVRKIDGLDGAFHLGARFVTMYALQTVAAGDLLAIDVNDTTNGRGNSVRIADNNAAGDAGAQARGLLCGVAAAAATLPAGATVVEVQVQVAGLATNVRMDAGGTQGQRVIAGPNAGLGQTVEQAAPTPNAAELLVVAESAVLGALLTDVVANVGTVWLVDPQQLSDD